MFPPVYNVVHENFCIAFLQFWISWQRKYLTSLVRKEFVHKAVTQFQCHPEVFLLCVTAILETSSLPFGNQLKKVQGPQSMNMGNGASTLLSVVFEPVAVCFAPPFKIIDLCTAII